MSKPKSNKAKGRKGQQEIRDTILDWFPELYPDDVRSTAMGQSGVDIQLSTAALKLLPISAEVKRRKSGLQTLYSWWEQAKQDGKHTPTVFFRQDRKPWLVCLSLDDYMEMVRKVANK